VERRTTENAKYGEKIADLACIDQLSSSFSKDLIC
jgi:hypothetical protein